MCARNVRHIPVVERGALVGMLSDRDLVRLGVTTVVTDGSIETLERTLATPASSVMRSGVITVQPETGLREVVGLLLENRASAIPVVHPDTNAVLGIVSYLDVLRAVKKRLEGD